MMRQSGGAVRAGWLLALGGLALTVAVTGAVASAGGPYLLRSIYYIYIN
jgi:hypothetical protein